MSISKSDIIKSVAAETNHSQLTVKTILDVAFAAIGEGVQTSTVAIRDFGTFRLKDRAARIGRNPSTGEAIDIPASKKIVFKATKHAA